MEDFFGALRCIQAAVPLSAADLYAQKQVLDLKNVSINGGAIAVRADDGTSGRGGEDPLPGLRLRGDRSEQRVARRG